MGTDTPLLERQQRGHTPLGHVVLLLVIVQITFAGNSVVAKAALDKSVDPIVFSFLRDVGATVILLCTARLGGPRFAVPRRAHFCYFALLGLLGVTIGQMFLVIALKYTTPLNAMVLQPSQPVLTVLIGALTGLEPLHVSQWHGQLSILGIVLAAVGAALALAYGSAAPGENRVGHPPQQHSLLIGNCLLGTQCLAGALYQLLQKRVLSLDGGRYPSLAVASWGYAAGAAFTGPVLPFARLSRASWALPRLGWLGLAYAVLLTSAFNYAAQAYANKRAGPTLVTAFFPLQSTFTAVFAFVFLHQPPTAADLAGLAAVTAARAARERRTAAEPVALTAGGDQTPPGEAAASRPLATPGGCAAAAALPPACCLAPSCAPEALRAAIQSEGAVAIRGFLSPSATAEARAEAERVVAAIPRLVASGAVPREHVMHDDDARPSTLKQLQQLHTHDAFFARVAEQVAPLAEAALGEPVVLKNVQYFNKPPRRAYAAGGSSQPTPPHQDGFYFMIQPPEQAVTAWLALDPADEDNGCLRYVRGSAAGGVRAHHYSGVIGFSQTLDAAADAADAQNEFALPAAPGDLLLHTAMMVHRADANLSEQRPRRAIGAIFYGASARIDAAYAAKQADIHRRARTLPGQQGSVALAADP
uniref:EamA domain-containing protein n=1 Tax=Emiliania huxleyi TaxID=2903 RepID=A0A7S3S1P7_EMIHU